MKKSNKPYKNTINVLKSIYGQIQNKYSNKIIDCELYDDKKEYVYSSLNFKLATPYYNVPIEIRRDYNYKPSMLMSIKFKNPRQQRRGITTGYCIFINRFTELNDVIINGQDLQKIYNELDKILNNIKPDGTWCDESKYDD